MGLHCCRYPRWHRALILFGTVAAFHLPLLVAQSPTLAQKVSKASPEAFFWGIAGWLVSPWLIAIAIQSQGAFFQQSLGNDFASKLAGGQESHGGWPGYFLLLSAASFWPAILFVLPGVAFGFARRATAYKRADLLFSDFDRLRHIATDVGRLRVVYAGKAHPRDEGG